MAIITTIEVRGKKFDIDVDKFGKFSTPFNGVQLRAVTLEALTESIENATKSISVKVNIPLYRRGNSGLIAGAATGIHAANGNVLIKWDDGKSEQANDYASFLKVSDAELQKANKLAEAVAMAQAEWYEFERSHTFRPKQEVLKAINADSARGTQG